MANSFYSSLEHHVLHELLKVACDSTSCHSFLHSASVQCLPFAESYSDSGDTSLCSPGFYLLVCLVFQMKSNAHVHIIHQSCMMCSQRRQARETDGEKCGFGRRIKWSVLSLLGPFSFLFFPFCLFLNWSIVDLQCCVSCGCPHSGSFSNSFLS